MGLHEQVHPHGSGTHSSAPHPFQRLKHVIRCRARSHTHQQSRCHGMYAASPHRCAAEPICTTEPSRAVPAMTARPDGTTRDSCFSMQRNVWLRSGAEASIQATSENTELQAAPRRCKSSPRSQTILSRREAERYAQLSFEQLASERHKHASVCPLIECASAVERGEAARW